MVIIYHRLASYRIDRSVIHDVEIDGVTLPAGSMFFAAAYVIHHDPEIWPDPESFIPDR